MGRVPTQVEKGQQNMSTMRPTGTRESPSVSTAPRIDAPGEFAGLVPSFVRHLRAENKSPKTIQIYTESATQFAAFLYAAGMPTDVRNIRREHVEAFIVHLGETRAAATARNRFQGLQRFFAWLQEEGEIPESPMARMKPPAVPEQEVPVLSKEEVRALLKTCEGSTFEDRRDNAIIRVFIATGARLSEVANLRLDSEDGSDLDLDVGVLRVLGKGRRFRLVGIGPKTVKAVDRYLRKRAEHPQSGEPWLWLGKRGRMTPSGIRQMIWRRSQEAGIEKRIHPHQLRHTWAHGALSKGMSETSVMKQAGWKSRAMLQRYASSTAEMRALEEHRRLAIGEDI